MSAGRKKRISRKWFAENGFELLDLHEKIGFEGAGDCLRDRGGPWLWTGYGFRTEIEAHKEIQEFFDLDLIRSSWSTRASITSTPVSAR